MAILFCLRGIVSATIDRNWIIFSNNAFGTLLLVLRHCPRLMDAIKNWNIFKLGTPFLYEMSKSVVVIWLLKDIKKHDSTRTNSWAGIPISIIWVNIKINKLFFKVMSSISPVLSQIKSQVWCHNLSPSVWHGSSCIHFPHESINKWHTSLSFLPSFDYIQILQPIFILELLIEATIWEKDFVAKMKTEEVVEISPEKFIN